MTPEICSKKPQFTPLLLNSDPYANSKGLFLTPKIFYFKMPTNASTAGVARRCDKSRGHSVTPTLSPAIISTIDNHCINREYLCRRDLSSTLPETMFSSSSLAISPTLFIIPPIVLKHDIIYLSDRSSSYIFSVTISSLKAE